MRRRTIGPGVSFFAFQDIITAVVGIFILITLTLVLELQQRVEPATTGLSNKTTNLRNRVTELEAQAKLLRTQYAARIDQHADTNEVNQFNVTTKTAELVARTTATQQQLDNLQNAISVTNTKSRKARLANTKLHSQAQKLSATRSRIKELRTELTQLIEQGSVIENETAVVYRDQVTESVYVCIIQLNKKGINTKDAATQTLHNFSSVTAFQNWYEESDKSNRHFLILIEPTGTQYFSEIRKNLDRTQATFGFDLVEDGHRSALSFEWDLNQ